MINWTVKKRPTSEMKKGRFVVTRHFCHLAIMVETSTDTELMNS